MKIRKGWTKIIVQFRFWKKSFENNFFKKIEIEKKGSGGPPTRENGHPNPLLRSVSLNPFFNIQTAPNGAKDVFKRPKHSIFVAQKWRTIVTFFKRRFGPDIPSALLAANAM
jgi:hypothetical protein